MRVLTRAEARANHESLLRLAAGPTRRHTGSRRARHTATDAAVYGGLVSFLNWQTGRCDPGYRRIADRAGVGLGTVSACMKRLVAAGALRVKRRPVRTGGQIHWRLSFWLAPDLRSENVAEPVLRNIPKTFLRLVPAEPVRTVAEQLEILAAIMAKEGRHDNKSLSCRPAVT
ncbi:hypothetical protein [Roseomonas sp. USHLN139]|uniref:hypothetical protein n=1 Tax=Roseomonas sp. USHLN139 TaxID=3081298 RepID=UPI003B014AA8